MISLGIPKRCMSMRSLAECKVNEEVTVVRIMGHGLEVRLGAMGLRVGDRVRVVSNIVNGPVIVENLSHGGRLALGMGMKHRIIVE